jgi:hypothetical protein
MDPPLRVFFDILGNLSLVAFLPFLHTAVQVAHTYYRRAMQVVTVRPGEPDPRQLSRSMDEFYGHPRAR